MRVALHLLMNREEGAEELSSSTRQASITPELSVELHGSMEIMNVKAEREVDIHKQQRVRILRQRTYINAR